MNSLQFPTAATPDILSDQLRHPTAQAIWDRAVEVFGTQAKADHWMTSSRNIFDGRSPEELVSSGEASQMRRVLEVLIRIDYGVFS